MKPGLQDNRTVDNEAVFDPRSVAIALKRRLPWMIVIIAVAIVVGLLLAFFASNDRYRATTVLMYEPAPGEQNRDITQTLNNEAGMVKVPSSLEELRSQLGINASIEELDNALAVSAEPRSAVVTIIAEWKTPERAAQIANMIRHIFLEQSQRSHREKLLAQQKAIEQRLTPLRQALADAKSKLQEFMNANGIHNLEEETRTLLQEQSSFDVLYQQAKTDQATVKKQLAAVEEMMPELRMRLAEETSQIESMAGGSADRLGRIQRLRQQIEEDRERRANLALLEQRRAALARVAGLREGVSQEEREKLLADVRAVEARLSDTTATIQWKNEIEDLYNDLLPSTMGKSPAASLLEAAQNREFELTLQDLSLSEKIASLDEATSRVGSRLARIPQLEPTFSELNRRVEQLQAEEKTLEDSLSVVDRELQMQVPRFRVLSEAVPPTESVESLQELYFLVGSGTTASFGFAALVASVLLGRRIRTSKDAQLATGHRVLAELPQKYDPAAAFPAGALPTQFAEQFRIIAEAVRGAIPVSGGKLLCVSPRAGEGTTLVSSNLAAVLAAQDLSVLLISADVRGKPQYSRRRGKKAEGGLRDLLTDESIAGRGLANFLAERDTTIDDIVRPTKVQNLDVIAESESAAPPDALGGLRMSELLEEASKRYSLVILDSPPLEPFFDARALARQCDAALLVVRAGSAKDAPARAAARVLEAIEIRVAGIVVTGVKKAYARRGLVHE